MESDGSHTIKRMTIAHRNFVIAVKINRNCEINKTASSGAGPSYILDFFQQNAIGHKFDPGAFRRVAFVSNLIRHMAGKKKKGPEYNGYGVIAEL